MNKKGNKLEFLLLLAIIVALGALVYFYFYVNINPKDDSSVPLKEIKANVEYENQKTSVTAVLSSFKKYGDWPEIPYQLSPARGNPFQEKASDNTKTNNQ